MGEDASKPNKEKIQQEGEANYYSFALCSMQGWRLKMEDFFIIEPEFAEKTSIFAILDGHGGIHVSKFVSENFCAALKENKNFYEKKYDVALQETFINLDKMLFEEANKNSRF